MNVKQADFVKSAVYEKDYPEQLNNMEFAFVGRSNVGKSSLINSITGRKKLAKTSKTPGRTQLINYFKINNEFFIVDLPGYGFAKVTQSVKEKWGHMIENYLQTSKQLKMVFLLIDIRHKPSKNDVMMYDWILHNGYRPVIIATKLDKLKRSQVPKHLKEIRTELQMDKETPIFPFSALSKQGRDEIWDFIESMVLQQEEAE